MRGLVRPIYRVGESVKILTKKFAEMGAAAGGIGARVGGCI